LEEGGWNAGLKVYRISEEEKEGLVSQKLALKKTGWHKLREKR